MDFRSWVSLCMCVFHYSLFRLPALTYCIDCKRFTCLCFLLFCKYENRNDKKKKTNRFYIQNHNGWSKLEKTIWYDISPQLKPHYLNKSIINIALNQLRLQLECIRSTGNALKLTFTGEYWKIILATHLNEINNYFLYRPLRNATEWLNFIAFLVMLVCVCVCVCSWYSLFMSVAELMLFKSYFMIAFHSMCLYIHGSTKTRHKILHAIGKPAQHDKTDEVLNFLLTKTGAAEKVFTLISSFGKYVSAKFDKTTETSNKKIM